MASATKRSFRFPNAIIIVAFMMVAAAVLTHIIPAGVYDVIPGTKILNPASYHAVAQNGTTPWGLVDSVFAGMLKAAPIVVFTFLVGGYFNVLVGSGSVDGVIGGLVRGLGSRSWLILPVLATIMSILGATGVMANPVVATIPIGIILARRLGADRITGVAVMFLAAYCGYAVSPMCAMTVQVAQKIADLPMLSGFGYRCLLWVVFTMPTIAYIIRYARRVQADPARSALASEPEPENGCAAKDTPCTLGHILGILGLVTGLVVYAWGSLSFKWGMNYMAGVMLLVALFAALANRMGIDGFVKSFLEGVRHMAFSAMLIGLATGISVVLTNGHVLHTIIYGMACALGALPDALAAPMMYFFNLLFNFCVPSGSGQAAVVMPIMAPLADVLHITRQTAVLAFQLGDGLSNIIYPTQGTMMACIALAGINFRQWAGWVLPLFLVWFILGTCAIALAVAMGY